MGINNPGPDILKKNVITNWTTEQLHRFVSSMLPTFPDFQALKTSTANLWSGLGAIAKGDLLVGDGSGGMGILPVGSDDDVLTADSAESLGVKWAAASTSGQVGNYGAFIVPTTSSQSISDSSWTEIDFHTQVYDTHGFYASGDNALYLPSSSEQGLYLSSAFVLFDANSTGLRGVEMTYSGGVDERNYGQLLVPANASGYTAVNYNLVFAWGGSLALKLKVYQSSGGSLNLLSSDDSQNPSLDSRATRWAVWKIGNI